MAARIQASERVKWTVHPLGVVVAGEESSTYEPPSLLKGNPFFYLTKLSDLRCEKTTIEKESGVYASSDSVRRERYNAEIERERECKKCERTRERETSDFKKRKDRSVEKELF